MSKINMRVFAKSVALREGGKVNLPIGQITEVVGLFCEEMSKFTDVDVISNIRRLSHARIIKHLKKCKKK